MDEIDGIKRKNANDGTYGSLEQGFYSTPRLTPRVSHRASVLSTFLSTMSHHSVVCEFHRLYNITMMKYHHIKSQNEVCLLNLHIHASEVILHLLIFEL